MNVLKKKEEQLKHFAKISNIIREKYKNIKFNTFSDEETAQNVLKPVVVPLQQLVEITENKNKKIILKIQYCEDDGYEDMSFKSTKSHLTGKSRSFQSIIESGEEKEDDNDDDVNLNNKSTQIGNQSLNLESKSVQKKSNVTPSVNSSSDVSDK